MGIPSPRRRFGCHPRRRLSRPRLVDPRAGWRRSHARVADRSRIVDGTAGWPRCRLLILGDPDQLDHSVTRSGAVAGFGRSGNHLLRNRTVPSRRRSAVGTPGLADPARAPRHGPHCRGRPMDGGGGDLRRLAVWRVRVGPGCDFAIGEPVQLARRLGRHVRPEFHHGVAERARGPAVARRPGWPLHAVGNRGRLCRTSGGVPGVAHRSDRHDPARGGAGSVGRRSLRAVRARADSRRPHLGDAAAHRPERRLRGLAGEQQRS